MHILYFVYLRVLHVCWNLDVFKFVTLFSLDHILICLCSRYQAGITLLIFSFFPHHNFFFVKYFHIRNTYQANIPFIISFVCNSLSLIIYSQNNRPKMAEVKFVKLDEQTTPGGPDSFSPTSSPPSFLVPSPSLSPSPLPLVTPTHALPPRVSVSLLNVLGREMQASQEHILYSVPPSKRNGFRHPCFVFCIILLIDLLLLLLFCYILVL